MAHVCPLANELVKTQVYITVPAVGGNGVYCVRVTGTLRAAVEDVVEFVAECDVLSDAREGSVLPAQVLHRDGHMVLVPPDPSAAPLLIVMTAAGGWTMPRAVVAAVGPFYVDTLSLHCEAPTHLSFILSTTTATSNTLHLLSPDPSP